MTRVLVTAFEPYGEWDENASWLTLMELTRELPTRPLITTRRYPVDFDAVRERLASDLNDNYDFVLLLGQAPGATKIQIEHIGVNVRGEPGVSKELFTPLEPNGPLALESTLPTKRWATELREGGLPVEVSYHAGEYLCNASLYWTLFFAAQQKLITRATFIHLPLTVNQTLKSNRRLASLPVEWSARAVRLLLEKCDAAVASA